MNPGSGAEAAGLQPGDVISSITGIEVRTMDELITALRVFRSGDTIEVTLADGSTESLTLTSR